MHRHATRGAGTVAAATVGVVAAATVAIALVAGAPVASADGGTGTPTPPATTQTTGQSTDPSSTPPASPSPSTPPPAPALLRSGDTGDRVKDLQSRLAVLGRSSGTIDGVYDAAVASALAGFLGANGLPGDGSTLTEQAWTMLTAQTASPVVIPSTTTGDRVKDLQSRMKIVGFWPYAVDGRMPSWLMWRVLLFQRAKDLPQSGVVDKRTWDRLVALTATPVVLTPSSPTANLKELELRLRAKGLWPYAITGSYWSAVGQRVLAFQRAYNLPQSGVVDSRTWSRLVGLTYAPGTFDQYRYAAGLRPLLPSVTSLDVRCRTGRVMCVDKRTRTLTWVVGGKPLMVMWARFGAPATPTREGTFHVFKKYEYVISNLYFTPMPYSMFFSGGQAVHYSSNFARLGYTSASHGCVNIPDYGWIKSLYSQVRIGDKVVVYH
jgi:peptidoglycan hydrolase-like protein with peptidoglycan-binding domain